MKNRRDKNINTLTTLGKELLDFGHTPRTESVIRQAVDANPWFSRDEIIGAVSAVRDRMLDGESLREWAGRYPVPVKKLDVGVIAAGNIPFVGFFDLLCVLVSGHDCYIKTSSKDTVLMEYIIVTLRDIDPGIGIYRFDPGWIPDAIIATGSGNTNRYFRYKYGGIPALLRTNRSSFSVLSGTETQDEIRELAHDIFLYSGLGCRNVSLLWLPDGYDVENLAGTLSAYADVNPKYIGNYRQRKSVMKMTGEKFIDGGMFVLSGSEGFPLYISQLNYRFYKDIEEVKDWLNRHRDQVQCWSGYRGSLPGVLPFGSTQTPGLYDYPDSVDTMEFLTNGAE